MYVDQLKNMLNWQLMAGSHEWPGPDGGTCINEAAIVAAGMPYKSVTGPSDIPVCFSRIIATFLMALNDRMDLKARQDLIEFIPRLAGSADNYKIEFKRAEYIIIQSFSKVFPCYLMNIIHDFLAIISRELLVVKRWTILQKFVLKKFQRLIETS